MAALDYPALFRRQVRRALDAAVSEVRTACARSFADYGVEGDSRALEILRFALGLPDAWPGVRELLLTLSPHMDRAGRSAEWMTYLRSGSDLARTLGDGSAQAELWMWLGVAQRTLGDYDEARNALERSAAAFAAQGDPVRYACVLNRLAWTERLAGNAERAKALTSQALAALGQVVPSKDAQLERARCYAILGALAQDSGYYTEAEQAFRAALDIPELATERARLAWGYADLGLALSAQGKSAAALEWYELALTVMEDLHAPLQAAGIQLNLSGIHIALSNPAQAVALCWKAHAVLERVNDQRRLAMVETNLGIAYRDLAQAEQAKQAFEAAIKRAEMLGNLSLLANALHELGLVHLGQGDVGAARDVFARALRHLADLGDSPLAVVLDQEIRRSLQRAQAEVVQV